MARSKSNDLVLNAVRPNLGLEAAYRRKLRALIDAMAADVDKTVRAAYRENEPKMAQDATPAAELQKAIDELTRGWQKRFNKAAPELAKWFLQANATRSQAALRNILRDAGMTVEFKLTGKVRDVAAASVAENVQLIKSIPQKYLGEVQGAVMRSVSTGRDLGQLTKDLQRQFGVTKKRAAFIARDQNNKATAAIQRARQVDLGITQGIWLHSHGGKEPRPTHLANSGKKFNVADGWFDPDPRVRKKIMPGELINCFPAETSIEFAHLVEKAYRHRYCGQMAEIVTDSGKTLRGTPNHPILTACGWRGLGFLDEGDQIVELSQHRVNRIVLEGDEQKPVPTIAQIFDSVVQSGARQTEVSLRDDFHGDGADGDVDVVLSDRLLSFGLHAGRRQGRRELRFSVTDNAIFRSGFAQQLQLAGLAAAARLVGVGRQAFSAGLAFAFHPHQGGVSAVSGTASGLDNELGDRAPVVASGRGKLKDACAGLVLPTQFSRIVKISRSSFDGHVFNLQTAGGWYVAQGIIAHNCRCVWKPVIKGFS